MDQPLVARRVRGMLEAGGRWVQVGATTHRGMDGDAALPLPRPPWQAIDELVAGFLGPQRRAGQGVLPHGTRSGEEEIMRQAGFRGPSRLAVGGGKVVERGVDEIVSAVFSLSGSAPHLFGDRLPDFEMRLRRLLRESSPAGRFAERVREIAVVIWRP